MPEVSPSKYLVQAGWDHVPHLDEKTKAEILDSTEPHLREARTQGVPGLGSGAIYPIPLDEVLCDPFEIPNYFPRCYGLDVGWNRTAALWAAWDREADVVYLYTEHYRGKAEPSVHATAIKARGEWIPGVIDPAAKGRSQKDGEQLLANYQDAGLDLMLADNAVESGILQVWQRLSTGRLKVFRTLQNWQAEYRLYRRVEDPESPQFGKIVKEFDHLMDAMRYIIGPATIRKGRISGLQRAVVKPIAGNDHVVTVAGGDRRAGY